jgi:hypothetical protein
MAKGDTVDERVCKQLRAMIEDLLQKAYNRDLQDLLAARGVELWQVGVDSDTKKYSDICGSVGDGYISIMQRKGFMDAEAGYLANADKVLRLDKKVDLFFLNKRHFTLSPDIEPVIVHELAHLFEQIKEPPSPEANDEANADAILASLWDVNLYLHPREWALHLAAAGRVLIEKKLTSYSNIREFLEVAVPQIDREKDILAK